MFRYHLQKKNKNLSGRFNSYINDNHLSVSSLKSILNAASIHVRWKNITQTCPCNIIQLLTIEALDMMWYRPENTDIDRGEAEVNIGSLRSISHHVQCLNSQQLFYYIIHLKIEEIEANLFFKICQWIQHFEQKQISFKNYHITWNNKFMKIVGTFQLTQDWATLSFITVSAAQNNYWKIVGTNLKKMRKPVWKLIASILSNSCQMGKTPAHATCSYISSSRYAPVPIRICLFINYIINCNISRL